jgi:predicted AlkP superfamily pyrophosphatase or phosphodiesterase
VAALGCASAQDTAAPVIEAFEPTLILISMDGFRADYLELVEPPNLSRLAARGVRAKALIPAYPSSTFPCHYTLVTGLYPGNHGIVFNSMRDAELGVFRHRDRESSRDSRWWGGEPIWATAERQGVTAATMFWPGSDLDTGSHRATYWHPYKGSFPYESRVEQVLEWIDLPPAERPRLITLYFQDPNKTSHRHGPEAPQTFDAVREVDARLGELVTGLEARGVLDRTNLVVVSDHGMAGVDSERFIVLDDYIALEPGEVFDQGAVLQIFPGEGREREIYEALRGAHPHLSVYRREEIPERYHLRDSPRAPPILGVPDAGWEVLTGGFLQRVQLSTLEGNHGQDPADPRMQGLFVAAGPAFRSGLVVEPFESVQVYNLLAAALELEPAPNDGEPDRLQHLLATECRDLPAHRGRGHPVAGLRPGCLHGVRDRSVGPVPRRSGRRSGLSGRHRGDGTAADLPCREAGGLVLPDLGQDGDSRRDPPGPPGVRAGPRRRLAPGDQSAVSCAARCRGALVRRGREAGGTGHRAECGVLREPCLRGDRWPVHRRGRLGAVSTRRGDHGLVGGTVAGRIGIAVGRPSSHSAGTMRTARLLLCCFALLGSAFPVRGEAEAARFDRGRDLFLPQFDCKTDVDDLHSVAAVATMLRDEKLAGVEFHAVAGAYGRQEGLYVPAPEVFELAFGEHWSDAHNDRDGALEEVVQLVVAVLRDRGSVWVAEGGQSDFTADWLARVGERLPEVELGERVHVVQHADWNESSTTPEKLAFVKRTADYHRIPDGNAIGNGTPGFKSGSAAHWERVPSEPELAELWRRARRAGETFNGKDGRYDNPAVATGGIDFSDTVETCWIFGFAELIDIESFFDTFSR